MEKKLKFKKLKEVPKDMTQRPVKRLFPTRSIPRKSLSPTYYPITDHIYYDGSNFRVRVRYQGITYSWNTSNKEKALQYRDYHLARKARS